MRERRHGTENNELQEKAIDISPSNNTVSYHRNRDYSRNHSVAPGPGPKENFPSEIVSCLLCTIIILYGALGVE